MSEPYYTILLIVEGKNTESLFFNSIRDEIINGTINIGRISITIRPEPDLDPTDNGKEQIGLKKRKTRQTKIASVGEKPTTIDAPLPLKWVLEGQNEELKTGTFNEVWTVFDHDNHPARKEANDQAKVIVEGKKVRIAFSSIAFEYYLLLHFERVYKSFKKSECRKGKIVLNCSSGTHPDDCKGNLCIGWICKKTKLLGILPRLNVQCSQL